MLGAFLGPFHVAVAVTADFRAREVLELLGGAFLGDFGRVRLRSGGLFLPLELEGGVQDFCYQEYGRMGC